MDPIPETTEAVEEYGPFEDDLLDTLRSKAAAARQVVPSCVGLSVASIADGVTFTLVASAEEIALLDALQYVTAGPCVEAVKVGEVLEVDVATEVDRLDESGWQLFAQGTAANNIASSLTLLIHSGARVAGSVNLYAANPGAFTDHHDELAEIFGAWAAGAVTNADLAFETRRRAEEAPGLLRANYRLEVASVILANRYSLDLAAAKANLHDAAVRAGISSQQLSEAVIALEHGKEA